VIKTHLMIWTLLTVSISSADSVATKPPIQLATELKCEFLHCAFEAMLTGLTPERTAACNDISKAVITKEFKNAFDQISFWINHSTRKEITSVCPQKNKAIESLSEQVEAQAPGLLAQIESNNLLNRDQALAKLKAGQAGRGSGKTNPTDPNDPTGNLDLSTDLKQGQAGLEEYLAKSGDPRHPMPLLPEHEKTLRCQLQLCTFESKAGILDATPSSRTSCNKLGFLLLIKSFRGDMMEQSNWTQRKSTAEEIHKSCPVESEILKKYELQMKKLTEKNSA
jgi:hypothetical protein